MLEEGAGGGREAREGRLIHPVSTMGGINALEAPGLKGCNTGAIIGANVQKKGQTYAASRRARQRKTSFSVVLPKRPRISM
jgi:hypothetical protein